MKTDEDEGVDQVVGADGHLTDDEIAAAAEEKRAKALGWSPKDQWRGDPAKWVPAEEFLDGVMANRKAFNDRFARLETRQTEQARRLEADNAELKRQLGETTQVLGELNTRQKTTHERAYAKAKADLEARAKAAVVDADVPAYEATQAEIKQLEKDNAPHVVETRREEQRREPERQAEDAQRRPQVDPAVVAWLEENPWYQSNPRLASHAMSEDAYLKGTKPDMPIADRLKLVADDTKKRFPEFFANERREAPAATLNSRGGLGGGNGQGQRQRGYADLPAEDKAQCDRFCRTIQGYTRENYMAEYLWPDQETMR